MVITQGILKRTGSKVPKLASTTPNVSLVNFAVILHVQYSTVAELLGAGKAHSLSDFRSVFLAYNYFSRFKRYVT